MKRRTGNGTINAQWLYIFVNFPLLILVKIGISGNVGKRRKQVSDKVFGVAIPVWAVYIPFAYSTEQAMHGLFSWGNIRLNGFGKEWFILPVLPFAWIIINFMFLVYWSWIWIPLAWIYLKY